MEWEPTGNVLIEKWAWLKGVGSPMLAPSTKNCTEPVTGGPPGSPDETAAVNITFVPCGTLGVVDETDVLVGYPTDTAIAVAVDPT
jgi:hypothetical protein